MRKLIRGERMATFGVMLGLFGLLCLLIGTLSLTLLYRDQARSTRGDLVSLKRTIYERCLQRQAYDQAAHASVAADVELYKQILRLQALAPAPTSPGAQRLAEQYRDAILVAEARKEAAVDSGVIGACVIYK